MQAQETKVVAEVVEAQAAELDRSELQAPEELSSELLRLVGGGTDQGPVGTW